MANDVTYPAPSVLANPPVLAARRTVEAVGLTPRVFLPRSGRGLSAAAPLRRLSTAAPKGQIAVVLSGSGVYDGSECTEAVAALVHVSRAGYTPVCFAPDKEQHHVVDHANVLVGYAMAVLAQILIFPIFGLHTTLAQNLLMGAIFTVVSIGRSYALRRLFEEIRLRHAR